MLNPQNLRSGEEQFEEFSHKGRTYVQYDFRDKYGYLFTTIAGTVEKCREKKNTWVINKHLKIEKEIRSRQGRAMRSVSV